MKPNFSNLVKKSDIESKYFTTYNYNNFTNQIIDNRIKGKTIVKKPSIFKSIFKANLANKILMLATRTELWILTGKKHPKIKLQCLRKIRILTFGSLVHQINSF